MKTKKIDKQGIEALRKANEIIRDFRDTYNLEEGCDAVLQKTQGSLRYVCRALEGYVRRGE